MIAALVALVLSGDQAVLQERLVIAGGGGGFSENRCEDLLSIQLANLKVTEAIAVPEAAKGPVHVAHCRVSGVVDKETRFTLLLPRAWNGKFVMGGGGGFVEGVDNQAIGSVNTGYATAGTDTGHQGRAVDASWALNNPERQLNFGHVAVHRVTEVSKDIIKQHYSRAPARSYFNGCSNGGRQALMEAQRYPEDFDGIVAGAPAYDFTGLAAQFIMDIKAAFPDKQSLSTPLFPADTLKSIESQIVAKCDALDGVTDGLMEDPRRCSIDASALTGLNDQQKNALKIIYSEKKLPDGSVIYPAQPPGGEGDAANGWPLWINGVNPMLMLAYKSPSLRFGFGTEFFKNFVFGDPSWDYLKYDFANYRRDSAAAGAMLNATDTNLDKFKARGGKLILYHGWSDAALSALATTKYYEQLQARDAKTADFARLFMMPGVAHCQGGPGPDRVDWNGVLDTWVEKGEAPSSVLAVKGGATPRSRPLCAYPLRAVYNGSGSIDDAANFSCSK